MPLTISGDTPNFSAATITAGTITTATITTGTVTTLNAPSGVLATQNGMTGIAKAWVNFAGASGTINGSFNVSSITRNGTGDYTFNFTTALPNTNYAFCGLGTGGGSYYQITGSSTIGGGTVLSTGNLRTNFGYISSTSGAVLAQDPTTGHIIIFSS